MTASTASGANNSLLEDTTLEERDVDTQSTNFFLSSNYIKVAFSLRTSKLFYKAI